MSDLKHFDDLTKINCPLWEIDMDTLLRLKESGGPYHTDPSGVYRLAEKEPGDE